MHAPLRRLRTGLQRATVGLLALAFAFAFVQCGAEPVLVVSIDPQRVPSATVKFLLRSRLNGMPGQDLRYAGTQRRIAVYLPQDATGDLKIDLLALDGNDCKLALAALTEAVPGGLNRTTERPITLTPLPIPLCTLTVAIDSGSGTVTSNPPGINCIDTDKSLCQADFIPGTYVTLSALVDASFSPVWSAPCMEQKNACPVTLVSSQQIHILFAPK